MRVVQVVYLDTIRGPPISAMAKQVESQVQIRQKSTRTSTRLGLPTPEHDHLKLCRCPKRDPSPCVP